MHRERERERGRERESERDKHTQTHEICSHIDARPSQTSPGHAGSVRAMGGQVTPGRAEGSDKYSVPWPCLLPLLVIFN